MLVYQRVNQETKGLCHWVELSRSSLFGQALENPRFRGLKVGISFFVDPEARDVSFEHSVALAGHGWPSFPRTNRNTMAESGMFHIVSSKLQADISIKKRKSHNCQ
jgi:hypothetical protein